MVHRHNTKSRAVSTGQTSHSGPSHVAMLPLRSCKAGHPPAFDPSRGRALFASRDTASHLSFAAAQ